MTLAETNAIYTKLTTNPLAVLKTIKLDVQNLPGTDTHGLQMAFGYHMGNASITIAPTVYFVHNFLLIGPGDCFMKPMLVTPTRQNVSPARGNNTKIFHGSGGTGADLWVTGYQTGCSLLISDWGSNRYSMVHLQPSDHAQFKYSSGLFKLGQTVTNLYKNAWLKHEVTAVTRATRPTNPKRYILVESMFNTTAGRTSQVIGVRHASAWRFFRQKELPSMALEANELEWTVWRNYVPYLAY